MIEVAVQDDLGVAVEPLVGCARSVCERLEVERATVGLLIVDAERMAAINEEHRDRTGPTDVLSFPVDGEHLDVWPADGPPPELGDIVICPIAASDPLTTLVVHGLLHLLGYDHETDEGEMLILQDQIVAARESAP